MPGFERSQVYSLGWSDATEGRPTSSSMQKRIPVQWEALGLFKSTRRTLCNCLFKTSNPTGSCLSHCKGPGVADSFLFPDWMVHYFRREIEPTSSALTRWRCYLRRVSFLILLLTFKRVLWTLLPKITFRTHAVSGTLSLEVKEGHTVCWVSRHCERDPWMFRLVRPLGLQES